MMAWKVINACQDWIDEVVMKQCKNVFDLKDFDAAVYLDNEESIVACLSDIFDADDAELLVSALDDIARALFRYRVVLDVSKN